MTQTPFEPGAEFDRQVRTLIDLGYPAMAGLGPATLAPLRELAVRHGGTTCDPEGGRVPFVLVLSREIAPIEQTMPLTTVHGRRKPGFVDHSFEPGALERFVAVSEVEQVYLLFDVERGEEFCGAVPSAAMNVIAARGRTLLTIEEGIALITHFPQLLAKNKCFSLGGSRCGDRRVPALWISRNAPKLGWCWEGNPHTWLGMASAGGRRAAA
ncbi:hypothetical protein HD597_009970 [Nonomuraea thailandensis]|uniref:Uncharacterized protein n=1 Tax=Nonomuraea thailandensis TaxID=1188745 RepID=A0A9X2K7U0_9ACTN|nr:DUF5701 family protein [Nonomuraea thailandensis]MCP2362950.1 hypothetical protein [Nonomuraea thailandensis]